jgi:hypothetical protein
MTFPRLSAGNRALLAITVSAVVLSTGSSCARAAMQDAETCRRFKAEQDGFNASGLREIMAKGPEWAKTNLTKERLEQVRRFLKVEEDLRFRCPLGKARPELEAAESEAGATTALQPGEQIPGGKAPNGGPGGGPGGGQGGGQAASKAAAKPGASTKAAAKKKSPASEQQADPNE